MIRRIFWPKEIRDTAEELQRRGALNEGVARYIDNYCYLTVVLSLLVVFLTGLSKYGSLVCSAVIFASLTYGYIFFRVFFFPRMIAPYILGNREEVTVQRISMRGALQNATTITCQRRNGKKTKIGALAGQVYHKGHLPKKGEKIIAFVHGDKAMPDVDYIRRKFSLIEDIEGA